MRMILEARRRRCAPCASWSRRCGWSWRAGPSHQCAHWHHPGRSAHSASWACRGQGFGFHCRQRCIESADCCSCLEGKRETVAVTLTLKWTIITRLDKIFNKISSAFTVSLAGVIYPGEVLVAAAFVGAFGVIADVGTDSKLQTLVLILKIWEKKKKVTWNVKILPSPYPLHWGLRAVMMHFLRVPPQVWCPIFWKPGLQEQKESVPLVTQWASSPSPHWVVLLRQSFSFVSIGQKTQVKDKPVDLKGKTFRP